MRTPQQALVYAEQTAHTGTTRWHNLCLGFVRACFDAPYKYAYAAQAWLDAQYRHPGSLAPEQGTPVFWTGGQHGYGHVALYAGHINGVSSCFSSDFGPRGYIGDGKVRLIPLTSIARYDSLLRYAGWTEDLNGARVWQR